MLQGNRHPGDIAGAGVGGLAIALAARSTLENFLGTLNLFADRPVRVGDFCRYGEDPSPAWQRIGTVEEIGLRSTRIRGLDRTITTIPNADFANLHIVNLTKRDGSPPRAYRSRIFPTSIGSRSWTHSTIHPMAHPERIVARPALLNGNGSKKENKTPPAAVSCVTTNSPNR
ncbi:MAG: mechanosensitive ion channel [Pseudomonadota bacterium]|nr:mechanosensitive ion channel [Pseudomonadota bacterium]